MKNTYLILLGLLTLTIAAPANAYLSPEEVFGIELQEQGGSQSAQKQEGVHDPKDQDSQPVLYRSGQVVEVGANSSSTPIPASGNTNTVPDEENPDIQDVEIDTSASADLDLANTDTDTPQQAVDLLDALHKAEYEALKEEQEAKVNGAELLAEDYQAKHPEEESEEESEAKKPTPATSKLMGSTVAKTAVIGLIMIGMTIGFFVLKK